VCFSFLLFPEVLPELSIRDTTLFTSRVRTEFFSAPLDDFEDY